MPLTQQQIDSYHRDGYLVVENAIDQQTIGEIRTVIAGFKEQSRHVAASDADFDIGPGHTAEAPKLRRLKDPHRQHAVFDELMRSPDLTGIVAPLLGGTARFDHSKLNFKPAGGKAKIEWHQDWAFYAHTNDDLLAVGVMIEDCTEENGPLMVIPGSHKGPVHDHHQNGIFTGGIPVAALRSEVDKAVALTAPAGSVSIHHVRTLHASSENRSDRERPLLLYSYSAVDAFPVFETYDLAEYDSRILVGEPTLAPRMEALPVRLHVPRLTESDSIYDSQAAMVAAE